MNVHPGIMPSNMTRGPCACWERLQRAARARNRNWLLGRYDGDTVEKSGSSTMLDRIQRIEAILFLAREPLNARKLAQFADLQDGTEARTLVRLLNKQYHQMGYAFRAEDVAGGFQLLTSPEFAPWLRRLGHVPPETRLSTPAMETLAVIAYRQPVLRADIESIRGVSCGEIIRQLMERDLVRIAGRSEELGRPYLYGTTKRFLQTFGMKNLDSLPRAELLRTPIEAAATRPAGDDGIMPDPVSADQDDQFVEPTVSSPSDSPQEEDS